MGEGNTFNQTNEAGSMGTQGQQGDAVAGDKIDGDVDKSQGKTEIAGDMSGNIENTNIQGGMVTFKEQEKAFFDEMVKNAPELPVEPREIPQAEEKDTATESEATKDETLPEPTVVGDDVLSGLEEIDFTDNEDHPAMVYSAIQSYEAAGTPPSEEEQKGLFQRAYSCVKKYATSPEAKAIAETAAEGIELLAGGLPFPANITVLLLKKVSGK